MSAARDCALMAYGLEGSASPSTDTVGYFPAPGACHLVGLKSNCVTAADFTTGDETGRVLIAYSTDGSNFTTVHTETAKNGNSWAANIPVVHTVTEAESEVRIPDGAVIRVTLDVGGTSPSFPNFSALCVFSLL